MKELLGEGYSDYLNSFRFSSSRGLRVNENKISLEDFQKLWKKCGLPDLEKIPWIHNGFFLPEGFDAADLDLYQAGLFYLQEPAAMSPAEYLPVNEGDRVLDLCAAPGGKSTELLSKLHGTGVLFSNDISASRARALKKNLELAGAVNAYVTAEKPETLAGFYPEYFQKILVDAPCSGEGMFRVQPAMMKHWEECGPAYYAAIQKNILMQAWRMLSPGGMLMYSTCTFSPLEDEEQILSFMKEHPDMEAVRLPSKEGFENLRDEAGNPMPFVRLYPHRLRGEGQFMALLRKRNKNEGAGQTDPPENDTVRSTFGSGLKTESTEEKTPEGNRNRKAGDIWTKENEVYLLPKGTRPEKSIHYLMTGLHIGTFRNGYLVPSQAYVMTLGAKSWEDVLDLSPEDERARKYLKGETVELTDSETEAHGKVSGREMKKNREKDRKREPYESSRKNGKKSQIRAGHGEKGKMKAGDGKLPMKALTLVCVGGYPLGFGQRNRNLLKNMRNPGWRIQK